MRKEFFAIALLALMLCALSTARAQETQADPELEEFLIEQDVKLNKDDRILKASLVSIVPTSERLIVQTVNGEKTLALKLAGDVKIKDGLKTVDSADLKRGDLCVVILRGSNLEVREIHKFH